MDSNKKIELRIWEYGKDDDKIESFLQSASLAHKIPQKSESWFHWKFEGSPYGKAILACAFDGNKVVGCVGYGMGIITHDNKAFKCALAYENFVHPHYQGHHIFTRLITLVENKCKEQGIKLLYVFPNKNSLPGYIKRGWKQILISKYKIRITNYLRFIRHILDIKKPFIPMTSNLEDISNINIGEFENVILQDIFVPQWSREYLEWRFHTYPVGNYWIYEDGNIYAIARLGHRGRLKQAEILHAQGYHRSINKSEWKTIIKRLIKETSVDFIGISASPYHPLSKYTSLFIPVPSKSNFTYKILAEDLVCNTFKMSKCDIDAHTY